MASGYISDDLMSNSSLSDGSEFSDAETVLLLSQPSGSEHEESDGTQVEVAPPAEDTHSTGLPVANSGSGTIHYGGYSYAQYHFNPRTDTRHYRCSAYRRTGCKAKLYLSDRGAVEDGEHKPAWVPGFRRTQTGPAPAVTDRKEEMLLMTDTICVRDVTLTPTEVWQMVRDHFYDNDNEIVRGPTKKQVLVRLYRTRSKLFGREIFGRLEREPLCDVKESAGLKFFQFHVTYYEDEVQYRLIGWAHPKLVDPMKQRQSSVFIDATYRCVPAPFYQFVIVMLYDSISELYLPIWYVLTTGKTAQVYDRLFHNIYVGARQKIFPAHVVCDFVIKSVQNQFPESRIVGCLFHFKQALRRKMLKLKITEDEVDLAMREGCIDRLTVIRRMDITLRGVHDVRSIIKRDYQARGIGYSRPNWKKFSKYFKKIWVTKFKPEWWNINSVSEDIVNRTNNPLERYNRTLNSAFSGAHPDITRFISVIEEQSRENVRLLNDISNRRARAHNHAGSQRAPAFESDLEFEVDSDSDLEVNQPDSDDSDSDSIRSMSPEY